MKHSPSIERFKSSNYKISIKKSQRQSNQYTKIPAQNFTYQAFNDD